MQMAGTPGLVGRQLHLNTCRISDSCFFSFQSAFPKSDSDLFEWIATIDGPPETVRILYPNPDAHFMLTRETVLCWTQIQAVH